MDDIAFNLIPIESYVTDRGLKFISFTESEEALAYYERRLFKTCCDRKISLVLTDIEMPVLNGLQLAKRIKTSESSKL